VVVFGGVLAEVAPGRFLVNDVAYLVDDEVVFFAGVILSDDYRYEVVCVGEEES